MSAEIVQSLTGRIASLEDIIRQQESTLTALLARLRDVEQFVGAEARNRDQTQQQLSALLGDRSGGTAQLAEKLDLLVQNQNDRISALQADAQAGRAALQGIDQKYDAAFRGLEQREQGDVNGCHERLKASEAATADAVRNLQTTVQGINSALQQIDLNARDAVQQVQQQVGSAVTAQQQRADALEGSVRDALRDVHGSLSGDIKALEGQLAEQLRTTVTAQNGALQSLDDRTRAELSSLHQQTQGDVNGLRQRLEELYASQQASLQSAHSALSTEIANVSQHSQGVDARQRASHQMLLQELSKHDEHLETVDNSWRSSVLELRGTTQEELAGVRDQSAAGDRALQEQIAAAQQRFGSVADKMVADLTELSRVVQDKCVVPVERTQATVAHHGDQIDGLLSETDSIRQFLRTFSQEADRNATQFRTVMEGALRASHSDLLDRINIVSAAIAMRSDPEEVHGRINEALTKIWNDANGTFVTQRDVGDLLQKISTLESAVRVEVVALAEKDNGLHRRIDELFVAHKRIQDAVAGIKGVDDDSIARATLAAASAVAEAERTRHEETTSHALGRIEELLREAKSVAEEAVESATAAEAAQDESVRAANEVRGLLSSAQQALKAQALAGCPPSGKGATLPPDNSRALVPVTNVKDSFLVQMPGDVAADSVENTPSPQDDSPASAANGVMRTVPLLRDLTAPVGTPTYYIDLKNRGGEGSRPNSRPPTHEGSNSRHGSSTGTEVLMPTHVFVRKREYTNFKDFTKQEIDALWVELLGMKRKEGLTREEVNLLTSQAKEAVLSEVVSALGKQERELISMLSAIRYQVSEMSHKPPVFLTDMSVLQANTALKQLQKDKVYMHQAPPPEKTRKPAEAVHNTPPSGRGVPHSLSSSARSTEALPIEVIRGGPRRMSNPSVPPLQGAGHPPALNAPLLFAEMSSAEVSPISARGGVSRSPLHSRHEFQQLSSHASQPSPTKHREQPVRNAAYPPGAYIHGGKVPPFVTESRRLSLTDELPPPKGPTALQEPVQGGSGTSAGPSLHSGPIAHRPLSGGRFPTQGSNSSGAVRTSSSGRGSSGADGKTASSAGPSVDVARRQRETPPTIPPMGVHRAGPAADSPDPRWVQEKTIEDLVDEHNDLMRQLNNLSLQSDPYPRLTEPGKPRKGVPSHPGSGPASAGSARQPNEVSAAPPGSNGYLAEVPYPYGPSKPSSAPQGRKNAPGGSFHLSPMTEAVPAPPPAASAPDRGSQKKAKEREPRPKQRTVHDDPVDSGSSSSSSSSSTTQSSSDDSGVSSPLTSDRASERSRRKSKHSSGSRHRKTKNDGQSSRSRRTESDDGHHSRSPSTDSRRRHRHRDANASTAKDAKKKSRGSDSQQKSSHRYQEPASSASTPQQYQRGASSSGASIRVLPSATDPVRVGGNFRGPTPTEDENTQARMPFPKDGMQVRVSAESSMSHPYAESSRAQSTSSQASAGRGDSRSSGVIRVHPYQDN